MDFVIYDTETTGTNTAFDQILQFGAIKTDCELNELDRFEIRCRLLPYVVPAPGAMRVTGISVGQLTDPALPTHYQMVRAIKAKLDEGIVRANSFTLPKRQNRISRPLIFLHFSGSI
jgi:exodeoxyribonuclease-1